MLRKFISVFIYLFAFLVTFVASFFVLIFVIFGKPAVPIIEWIINAWAQSILFVSGVKMEIRGKENYEGLNKGVIFVSNHLSLLDIPVAVRAISGKVRFMAKKSLFKIPVFGHAMRRAAIIEIDRKNPKAAISAINRSEKYLEQGYVYVVFPEGTRSLDNDVHPFKKGPIVLAINNNIPIVPMAITGTFEILPKNRFEVIPGRVIVEFSEKVDTSAYNFDDREELKKQLENIVKGTHLKNLKELRNG